MWKAPIETFSSDRFVCFSVKSSRLRITTVIRCGFEFQNGCLRISESASTHAPMSSVNRVKTRERTNSQLGGGRNSINILNDGGLEMQRKQIRSVSKLSPSSLLRKALMMIGTGKNCTDPRLQRLLQSLREYKSPLEDSSRRSDDPKSCIWKHVDH